MKLLLGLFIIWMGTIIYFYAITESIRATLMYILITFLFGVGGTIAANA